jgi:hypothetical protein
MPAAAPAVKLDNRQLLNEEESLTAEEQAAVTAEAEQPPAEAAPPVYPQPEQPETTAAPQQPPPGKPPKKPEEAIPYERFRDVYEETKRKDRELAEMRERWARLEERQQLAREAQQRFEQARVAEEQKARLPEKPDAAVDPYGAQLWDRDRKIEALQNRLEQVVTAVGTANQNIQQTSQLQDFNLWLTNDINNYRGRQVDYDQAAQHARNARIGFWQSVGLPPEQAEAVVNNEALAIAYAARQNGKSAAQAYYDAAKVMGYQGAAQNGNGAPAPVSGPPSAQEKMAQLRKGQSAQGLSRAPVLDDSNANWSSLSAQQIADMDENDFVEALQDPARAQQLNKVLERLEGIRQ